MNSPDPWSMLHATRCYDYQLSPAPYYQRGFIGAEPPRRSGLTAEVAPVLAPTTSGITAHIELDQHQHLHAEICVDGRCYKTCVDLAPAIAAVMTKIAQHHVDLHTAMRSSRPMISGEVAIGAIDDAVGAAGDALVDTLVDRHYGIVCSGWLSDIGDAVKGAVRGAGRGMSRVASTLKRLQGPIAAAAGIAAASAAAAIPGVGPVAAPLAGKLATDLVNSAAGDKAAKKRVAAADKQAKTDPTIALALDVAKKAAAHSTASHHVADTAKKAAAGQPDAQRDIAKVAEDAEKGDPASKVAADLVANVMKSEWGAKLWEKATGRGPETVSGWVDMTGRWVDMYPRGWR